MTHWLDYLSYFFGGAFLTNAIPHWVAGLMGEPFQTPFANPSGKGLSSSTVNVLWAGFNFLAAYVLLVQVGAFDLHATGDVAAAGAGALLLSLVTARLFGALHGGNLPRT